MTTLSLAMIVRDEEATIGEVLGDAAAFCDELIVVDTGSTDRTVELAERAGARVVHFAWIDDFAAARNFSFEQATCDWVLWLDADDRIAPAVQARFREAKASLLEDPAVDVVLTPYHYAFAPTTGECTFSLHRERLVRRSAGLRWEGVVHESIPYPAGRYVHREDLVVEHRPPGGRAEVNSSRNLAILERAYQGGDRAPRTLFYYANELRDAGRPADALLVYKRYIATSRLAWERYAAHLSMSRCARALGDEEMADVYAGDAVRFDPSRSEGYLALAQTSYDHQRWAEAVPLYAAATMARRPAEGFVDEADYGWRPWDLLGIALINSGRYDEGIRATLRSLELGNRDVDRLRANIDWAVRHLS